MTWSFYRKTKFIQPRTGKDGERLQIQFSADTPAEAERCRQSMIEEFGAASVEVREGTTVIPTNQPIAAGPWKQSGTRVP